MDRLRLLLAVTIFAAYCLLFGVIWLENNGLQAIALLVVLLLCLIWLGWDRTRKQLKVIAPFALSLLIIYSLLILLGIAPGEESALDYWLRYGLPRLLLLISTLLSFRLCVSLLSYAGMLRILPNIHWQKYLILGQILYQAAFRSYPILKSWQELIPSARIQKKGFKTRFNKALAASLALALYVMEEARLKGEQIDNRIDCCHKEL